MTAAQGSGDGGGGMGAAKSSSEPRPAAEVSSPSPERGNGSQRNSAMAAARRVAEFESVPVLIALILIVVFITSQHPDFFQWPQLKDVLQQSVYVGILAAGMSFLIAMRELDLSVGSQFGLTLIISALLMSHGTNPWLAVILGILLGGAMGLLNAI